jgi:hypothetical protein
MNGVIEVKVTDVSFGTKRVIGEEVLTVLEEDEYLVFIDTCYNKYNIDEDTIVRDNIPDEIDDFELDKVYELVWLDKMKSECQFLIKKSETKVDKDVEVICEFGGFYESIHSQLIDNTVEMFCSDDSGDLLEDFEWDKVNYKKLYEVYVKTYTESILPDAIFKTTAKEVKLTYLELNSPRYYNYSTDELLVKIDKDTANLLIGEYLLLEDFVNYVENFVKEHEYTSSYSVSEIFTNKDNILLNFILDYESENINEGFYSVVKEDNGHTYYEELSEEVGCEVECDEEEKEEEKTEG